MFILLTLIRINAYVVDMKNDLIYKEFGRLLKKSRTEANLTQEALAKRVGLSRTSITNIEKGRQHINLHMLYVLSDSIGIRPSDLLPDKVLTDLDTSLNKVLSKANISEDAELEWIKRRIIDGIAKEVQNEED
jgi:transcriptional regulator with XRE-family HTH domain